jgi:TonB-dependent starch-binding outer membrane protein SusC
MSVQKLLSPLLCVAFVFVLQVAYAQDKTITGKVTDSKDGSPVVGATVQAKGTRTGTSTKADGTFSITVASNVSALVITSVGYDSQEIAIADKTSIDVSFVPNAGANLNEVIVTGYGTSRKRDLTGSIGSVKEKDFNKGVYTSPDQLIQGKLAGVQIYNNSGQPGGGTTVKIRGNSSVSGGGQPLYVVDGVPLDNRSPRPGVMDLGFGAGNPASNPLNFLNPADIASMDVLKDASATAIYGSRAAYGVVLITTKKGQAGQTKIDFGTSMGVSTVMRKIEILNTEQYKTALTYYGEPASFNYGGSSDPFDAITQSGFIQNYNISISGGNENARYRLALSALDQKGIIVKTGIKKLTANLNAQYKFLESKKLGLDINIIPSQYTEDIAPISNDAGAEGSLIGMALQWNPTLPLVVKRANGTDSAVNVGGTSIINPVGMSQAYNDESKVTTVLASISPYYKFNSWLEYRFLYSVNYAQGVRRTTVGPEINIARSQGKGFANIGQNEFTTQQYTHTLNFNRAIGKSLNLNAVVGYEYMKFINKGFNLNSEGPAAGFGNYGLNYTNYIQFGNSNNRGISSYFDPTNELQSYFARTAFNYRDKYLVTATFRADGSTKFGSDNKYGYFPSFAAGWVLSKEDFFHVDFINSLKIRGGWGKTGNQEFPSGAAQSRYALNANGAIQQVNAESTGLQWQSDRQFNVGFDATILNNKVTVTVDYFNKRTTDLLYPSVPAVPVAPGAAVKWVNIDGNIDNKGFEFTVNSTIVSKSDFSWDLGVNATFIDNNVSGLKASIPTGTLNGQGVSNTRVQVIQNGLPMNAFVTRQFLGMDKNTGQALYTSDGNEFFYVGNPNPKTLLGLSTTLNYKKFSFTANMNGAFGHVIYNNTLNNVINVGSIHRGRNIAVSVYEDPIKESFTNPVTSSSRFLEKGNYVKLTNATISYAIGNVTKIFKGANIYLTGQNLFVITKFSGFDPEVNVDKNVNGVPSVGIEYIPYPSARTITLGLNFSL